MKAIKKINCFLFIILCLFIFNNNVQAKETSATCVYDINKYCGVKITITNSKISKIDPIDKKSSSATCFINEDTNAKLEVNNFQDITKKTWKCPSTLYYKKDETHGTLIGKTRHEILNFRFNSTGSIKKAAKLDTSKSKQGHKYEDTKTNQGDVYYCPYSSNLTLNVDVDKKKLSLSNTSSSCKLTFTYNMMQNAASRNRNGCLTELYLCYKTNHGDPKFGTESYSECGYYIEKQTGQDCRKIEWSSETVTDANGNDANEAHREKINNGQDAAEAGSCGFIGPRTLKIIKWAIRIIRIGVPVLIIVLGVMDFISAIFGGEDKTLKEALSRFSKRLLAGVILLFVPYILMFMVRVSGIDKDTDITVDDMFCTVLDD